MKYIVIQLIFVQLLYKYVNLQDDEDNYKGKYIGKLKSYHHQVSGKLYAVDEYTILFKHFNYDGNGLDTYFWAGITNRPGPQGFLVPNEHGRTDLLVRYLNKDFTLTLPDGKKITDIKWLAIYDLTNQVSFADIYIPEEFDPPSSKKISELSKLFNHVSSGPIEILDSKTIKIPQFRYDGKAKAAHFWMGVGPQPVSKGYIVPDENGYMDAIRAYEDETILLHLPGDFAIFKIDWFSIFDLETMKNLGSVIIPNNLNVPPSLTEIIEHKNNLPFCKQLHNNFQVSWEVFGHQITIQLAAQINENDYMSFGISGSESRSEVIGADVVVAYLDKYRGHVVDYNISAKTSCVKILGQYKGVCKDELVGGQENNQLHTAVRENGINVITYRRALKSPDLGDKEYITHKPLFVVWSLGRLNEKKEPAFHDYYSKANIKIDLNLKESESNSNCYSFTRLNKKLLEPWKKEEIFDPSIRRFKVYVGPSGGKRGYQSITGHTSNSLSWYINGFIAPVLWLRRGLTYYFEIYGGNNPHSVEYYHPFIITNEPHGGFDALSDLAQDQIKVFAGVEFTRRGRPRPTSAGPLCLAKHQYRDRRLDDDFPTFKKFNKSLELNCEIGQSVILEVTPNSSWPDIVYYNSFTHSNMGWKIRIVDTYRKSAASISYLNVVNVILLLLALKC